MLTRNQDKIINIKGILVDTNDKLTYLKDSDLLLFQSSKSAGERDKRSPYFYCETQNNNSSHFTSAIEAITRGSKTYDRDIKISILNNPLPIVDGFVSIFSNNNPYNLKALYRTDGKEFVGIHNGKIKINDNNKTSKFQPYCITSNNTQLNITELKKFPYCKYFLPHIELNSFPIR